MFLSVVGGPNYVVVVGEASYLVFIGSFLFIGILIMSFFLDDPSNQDKIQIIAYNAR